MNQSVLGCELPSELQAIALRRADHRFTLDHVPGSAARRKPNGKYPAPRYASDAEWLENTLFHLNDGGELDLSLRGHESINPSWPLGLELDEPLGYFN